MSITIFKNISLTDADTANQTSSVGEPSIANNGEQILMSGNWYASRSLDNGDSWDYISPYNFFPPAGGGFCCDQTILYDNSRDLTFWILQYVQRKGTNVMRLAVKKGKNLGNNNWYWWDLEPKKVNKKWRREWFDFNHAALSNNFLYIGTNVFKRTFTRSVVFRIPLDLLAKESGELKYDYIQSESSFSLRCVQGARNVMHFASHISNSKIRLFSWPENSSVVIIQDFDVTPWQAGSYSAPGPDGSNWLSRVDPRITGGWYANGKIGLMWSANRESGNRPFPFVRVVIIDTNTREVISEPDIWSNNYAFTYPDACPNDRGEVGIAIFRGGGKLHPSHCVGIWDEITGIWELAATKNGTN
ncbi:MAG: hypothetical protein IIA45_13295, partial [Bacteroidetes bacterium]|nr:hypothetical protein [Bacteroidota bacterium]